MSCQTTPFNGHRIVIGRNTVDLLNGAATEWSFNLRDFFETVNDNWQPLTFVLKPGVETEICWENVTSVGKIKNFWAFAQYVAQAPGDPAIDTDCIQWAWKNGIDKTRIFNADVQSYADSIYSLIINQLSGALNLINSNSALELELAESNLNGNIYLAQLSRDRNIEAARVDAANKLYLNPDDTTVINGILAGIIFNENSKYDSAVISYTTIYNNEVLSINETTKKLIESTTLEYQSKAKAASDLELSQKLVEEWSPFHKVLVLTGNWDPDIPEKTDFLINPLYLKNPTSNPVTVKILVTD